jgi:murein DD-endopeptidase MepM/ murein hydrolase activator NlpD
MPERSLIVRYGIALAALLAAGCATPGAKMSFGDAGFRLDEDGDVAPPVRIPAPEAVASEIPQGPPIDPILLRFAAEARSRRGRTAELRGYPPEAIESWRALTADLDQYLLRPLPQTPLLELVRARITLDAEWDYDRRRYGAPPRDLAVAVLARATKLAARIETARAVGLAVLAKPPPARLRWPVDQAGISSPFGVRFDPFDGSRRMHRGIDFSADRGELVVAAARGWVVRAGPAGGYGLMVEVRHPGDVTTRYGHLSSILCTPGDAVEAGQGLGLVGQTGRATGPHLHFEIWKGGLALDPLPWLAGDRGDRVARGPAVSRRGSSGGPR